MEYCSQGTQYRRFPALFDFPEKEVRHSPNFANTGRLNMTHNSMIRKTFVAMDHGITFFYLSFQTLLYAFRSDAK